VCVKVRRVLGSRVQGAQDSGTIGLNKGPGSRVRGLGTGVQGPRV
jgi:hypothetical protein